MESRGTAARHRAVVPHLHDSRVAAVVATVSGPLLGPLAAQVVLCAGGPSRWASQMPLHEPGSY